MEVKPGYKQTEIGVIPEDWVITKLGGIVRKMQLGGNYSNSEVSTGPPLIKMGNIGRGTMSVEKLEYISNTDTLREEDILSFGDILFNTRNTLDLVGKVAIWRNELPYAYFNSNIMKITFEQDILASNEYANYLFNSQYTIRQLRDIATGTTSVAAIYTRDLLKINIIVCPTDEQFKIAISLSDIDSLITSLEKLIEKKKLIKQGVMQELLTGKRRLPGFSGDWETKRLGDLCSHITTGRKDVNEGNPNGMYPFFTCSRAITYSDHFSFDTEAILIAGNGDVGTLHYFTGKFEAYQRTYVLTGFSVKARYLVHYLNMYLVPTLCDSKIGTSIPYIKIGDLINMPVIVPMDDAEVKHVISVIDDIELEIDMHVVQLKKHELLKQAMMQELLTGRIRLV